MDKIFLQKKIRGWRKYQTLCNVGAQVSSTSIIKHKPFYWSLNESVSGFILSILFCMTREWSLIHLSTETLSTPNILHCTAPPASHDRARSVMFPTKNIKQNIQRNIVIHYWKLFEEHHSQSAEKNIRANLSIVTPCLVEYLCKVLLQSINSRNMHWHVVHFDSNIKKLIYAME